MGRLPTPEYELHHAKLIGERIRRFRELAHVGLDELARFIGITPKAMARIEAGTTVALLPGRLQRIANALGRDVAEFFEDPPAEESKAG